MQFKVDRGTFADHQAEFKARVKARAEQKFANIYGNREAAEDFIKAIDALVAKTAIPAGITTSFNQVKAIRSAQQTANQSINAATTVPQLRAAWDAFVISIKAI